MSKFVKDLVNTIRCVAIEQVAKANSGHQGLPMGFAPTAHMLCSKHYTFSAKNPKWINRDRLILSAGHGSALLYTMLHLLGYDIKMKDLKDFRTLHSITPGHPESRETSGVEFSSGPLGQGLAASVGMAIAYEYAKKLFNVEKFPLFNHKIFVLCGDGCLQEGVTSEACSMAGHLGLSNLIVLYDDNHTTIDGHTDITWTEDVYKRFEAYGWNVLKVEKGDDDFEGISKAIEKAKAESKRPTIIGIKTTIGCGGKQEGKNNAHGFFAKLPDCMDIRKKFGLKEEHFHIPDEVYGHYKNVRETSEKKYDLWEKMLVDYKKKFPKKGALLDMFIAKKTPSMEDFEKLLPKSTSEDKSLATRKMSGKVLNKVCEMYPFFIGGSADLEGSNCTKIANSNRFSKENRSGKILAFGVREHAMMAMSNGLAEYGGFVPFCATFLVFTGYLKGALRISCLAQLQVVCVFTHDSIAIGQDGPSHQPVETVMQLRQFPNILVHRPCDMNEVSASYALAFNAKKTPSIICLSRQNVDPIKGTSYKKALKGGYVINEDLKENDVKLILVSTGSEVSLCVKVSQKLKAIRVVSMPCMEMFNKQSLEYKKKIFMNCKVPVISVEAGTTLGWERYSHAQIGVEKYGASAPDEVIYPHFGFNVKNIQEKVEKTIKFYENKNVPNFIDKPF